MRTSMPIGRDAMESEAGDSVALFGVSRDLASAPKGGGT